MKFGSERQKLEPVIMEQTLICFSLLLKKNKTNKTETEFIYMYNFIPKDIVLNLKH